MKIYDTTFLIDLQRDFVNGTKGPSTRFLESHPDEDCAISVISEVEFLEGYEQYREGLDFLAPFQKRDVTRPIALIASRIRRRLRRQGSMIGDFDILIASTALDAESELVTANTEHFARISDLKLVNYRKL